MSKNLKRMKDRAIQTSVGKAFQADGIARAKFLGQEYSWHVQETAKRLERK